MLQETSLSMQIQTLKVAVLKPKLSKGGCVACVGSRELHERHQQHFPSTSVRQKTTVEHASNGACTSLLHGGSAAVHASTAAAQHE